MLTSYMITVQWIQIDCRKMHCLNLAWTESLVSAILIGQDKLNAETWPSAKLISKFNNTFLDNQSKVYG